MRDNIAVGAFLSGTDYVQAVRRRRELCATMAAAMTDIDILLSVGANAEAPLMTEVGKWDVYREPLPTMPFNVTGYPTLTICSGYGSQGMPVGIQLTARPFEEPLLLRVVMRTNEKPRGASGDRPLHRLQILPREFARRQLHQPLKGLKCQRFRKQNPVARVSPGAPP